MNQRLNTRATGLTRSLIAAALLATTGLAAQAHQVWLEHSGSQAKLHFGEYNDNVRETSPGLLDKFKGVPVLEQTVAGAKQRVEGQLTKEAFTYTAAANAETLFADAAYPLIDRSQRNLPPMAWQPSARWVAGLAQPVAPTAPLDLVPTGKPGEFKVVFKGAPLPTSHGAPCRPNSAPSSARPRPCAGRAESTRRTARWGIHTGAVRAWRACSTNPGAGPCLRRCAGPP